jgi:hypothetical protein
LKYGYWLNFGFHIFEFESFEFEFESNLNLSAAAAAACCSLLVTLRRQVERKISVETSHGITKYSENQLSSTVAHAGSTHF